MRMRTQLWLGLGIVLMPQSFMTAAESEEVTAFPPRVENRLRAQLQRLQPEIHAQTDALAAIVDPNVEVIRQAGPNNAYTIFQPRNMNNGRHGLVTWGNGTGARPDVYAPFLRHLASQGLIVIASNVTNTGTGVEMLDGVRWMKADSGYSGRLNGKTVAMGHSQGGTGAFRAAKDPLINSSVLINPFVPFPGTIPDTFGPCFLIAGERDSIVPSDIVERAFNAVPGQKKAVFAIARGQNHFGAILSARPYAAAITKWCLAELQDDGNARAEFERILQNHNEWPIVFRKPLVQAAVAPVVPSAASPGAAE